MLSLELDLWRHCPTPGSWLGFLFRLKSSLFGSLSNGGSPPSGTFLMSHPGVLNTSKASSVYATSYLELYSCSLVSCAPGAARGPAYLLPTWGHCPCCPGWSQIQGMVEQNLQPATAPRSSLWHLGQSSLPPLPRSGRAAHSHPHSERPPRPTQTHLPISGSPSLWLKYYRWLPRSPFLLRCHFMLIECSC